MIELAEIEGSFELIDNMPRPQWDKIGAWIDEHIEETHRDAAWSEATCQWLERLASHLGEPYWVGVSERHVLLAPRGKGNPTELLRFAEAQMAKMSGLLRSPAAAADRGKRAILLFDDLETYYTYACYFTPDGEYPGSAGMCVQEAPVHVVLQESEYGFMITLAHELTHAHTAHLPLPLWVTEGIAQFMEQSRQCVQIDHERARLHRQHWRENGLQGFWSGEAFTQPLDGVELAYELAEILTRNLIADYEDRFVEFLQSAHSDDDGAQAAQDTFGLTLAEIAAGFLGEDL